MAFYALAMAGIAPSSTDRAAPGDRPRAQVPRALRAPSRTRWRGRRCGTSRTGSTTTGCVLPDGTEMPSRSARWSASCPLLAAVVVDEDGARQDARRVGKRVAAARAAASDRASSPAGLVRGEPGERLLLLGVVGSSALRRVFDAALDEDEFLSPYGLRACPRYHLEHPFELEVDGITATIDYEPAESTTAMFGGNSNWRGPIWIPVNYLVLERARAVRALLRRRLHGRVPDRLGQQPDARQIADDLRDRLISLFLVGADGRRPCFGGVERLQTDPAWRDNILFNEYFHGDNGAGLGASHQTGWTGLVADLIIRRRGPTLVELVRRPGVEARASRRRPVTRKLRPRAEPWIACRSSQDEVAFGEVPAPAEPGEGVEVAERGDHDLARAVLAEDVVGDRVALACGAAPVEGDGAGR